MIERLIAILAIALGMLAVPARAGTVKQHYMYLFALDDGQQTPTANHTWATFVEVTLADGSAPAVQFFTIDWLPRSGIIDTLAMGPVRGRNFPLDYPFQWAVREHLTLAQWGPYQVQDRFYDLAVKQKALLDSGEIWYRVLDNPNRILKLLDPANNPAPRAVMCIHAVSDLVYPADDRGFLLTGFASGIKATAEVVWHLAPWFSRQSYDDSQLATVDAGIQSQMDTALGLTAYPIQLQTMQPQNNQYCKTLEECRKLGDGAGMGLDFNN
jgi:hypothetical protein